MRVGSNARLLAVGLVGIFSCAVSSLAGAQNPTRVRVISVPVITSAPLQIAIQKGFFADEKLDIQASFIPGGAIALPTVIAGQADIVMSSIVTTILADQQGLGLQIVAPAGTSNTQPPDAAALVAKSGSGFRSGKDLEGKRLAVNTRNNILWLYARAWIEKTGGDATKVTFLEVPVPQMIDAIQGGRVDAAFVIEPFLAAEQTDRVAVIAYPYFDVQGGGIPNSQFVALKTYIAANSDTIERFSRAYNRGVDWLNERRGTDEWIDALAKYTKMSPDLVRKLPASPFVKSVEPIAVNEIVKLMKKHGMLNAGYEPKDLIYRTAIPNAP